jgi:hypothetical protein
MPEAAVSTLFQLLEQTNSTVLSDAARDLRNDLMGFVHAIDWSEQWLMGLAAFHALMWLVAIASRRSHDAQMVLLVVILGLVYCAERVNTLAGAHWQSFATQNYFDRRGVFVSVMYSAPLLCLALLVLLNALRAAGALLIQVKRKELRVKAKAKSKTS